MAIYAVGIQGNAALAGLGLDLGLLLAHRHEPWAVVGIADDVLTIRFTHTPEAAAKLVADWLHAEDVEHDTLTVEAAVMASLKAQALSLH